MTGPKTWFVVTLLWISVAPASFGTSESANAASSRSNASPNFLVIMADDLGYGDVSYMGHAKDVKTPHIDSLAKGGIHFTDFYANCPVCSPTRAALLSGRYQDMVGVPGVIRTHADNSWGYLDPKATLLPKLFQKAGYHTAIVGKWHLGLKAPNIPNRRGFDFFHGFLGDMMDDYYDHRRHGNNYMFRNLTEIDPDGHATDLFTDWACDYLKDRKQQGDKPWLLYLAYNAPHTPIQPPDDWLQRVRDRHKAGNEDVVKVSFNVLDPLGKPAEYQYTKADVTAVTRKRRAVDGRRVRIRGFMFPTYKVRGIEKFFLAKDNGIMAFARAKSVTELIPIELKAGSTTEYIEGRPFDVVGTLHIDPVYEDGELVQLYRIDDAEILSEDGINERRAKLVALIEHMDDGIGKVLKALQETGQKDNTIIVFTSDNGGPQRCERRCEQGGLDRFEMDGNRAYRYEGGLKVPTCVVWPGTLKGGTKTNFNESDVDGSILPTLMDIAGIDRPSHIEGRSFRPMGHGRSKKQIELRSHMFFSRREGGRNGVVDIRAKRPSKAVRWQQWKLLQNSPFAPLELYNVTSRRSNGDDQLPRRSSIAEMPETGSTFSL